TTPAPKPSASTAASLPSTRRANTSVASSPTNVSSGRRLARGSSPRRRSDRSAQPRGTRHLRRGRFRSRRQPGIRSRPLRRKRGALAGQFRGRARRAGEGAPVQAAQPAGAQPARAFAVQAGRAIAGGGDLPVADRGPSGGSHPAGKPWAGLPETKRIGGRGALLRDGARSGEPGKLGRDESRKTRRAAGDAGDRADFPGSRGRERAGAVEPGGRFGGSARAVRGFAALDGAIHLGEEAARS